MITKRPNNCLTNNIVETLKVSSIDQLFDNLMYVRNPQNANFDDLPFDGDQVLITRQLIYRIKYGIVERLNNGLIVDVYKNLM